MPNTYWTLDDLKTSKRVGLEAHLEDFVVEGKVRLQDKDVAYRIVHEKKPMWGWAMDITADSPEVRAQVYDAVKSLVGGRDTRIDDREYLNPHGKPSTSEIIAAVVKYSSALGEIRISKINFLGVPKEVYKKATEAKLELQEVKST